LLRFSIASILLAIFAQHAQSSFSIFFLIDFKRCSTFADPEIIRSLADTPQLVGHRT